MIILLQCTKSLSMVLWMIDEKTVLYLLWVHRVSNLAGLKEFSKTAIWPDSSSTAGFIGFQGHWIFTFLD